MQVYLAENGCKSLLSLYLKAYPGVLLCNVCEPAPRALEDLG